MIEPYLRHFPQAVIVMVALATGLTVGPASAEQPIDEALAAGTNPATAELIRQMPPDAFEQVAPVFWLADDAWAQAYLTPDQNPDFCLAITFKRVDGRLQWTRLDLVHFPSTAAAARKGGAQ